MPGSVAFKGTDRFKVVRVLGEGANGVVYEAIDKETQLKVALKTLRMLNPDTLFQFKQEFRSIQNLNHPNLVELFDFQTAHGTWFFTMQLVEGAGLLQYVRPAGAVKSPDETTDRLSIQRLPSGSTVLKADTYRMVPAGRIGGTLDLGRLRASMAQVVRGLMALHEWGRVHRDIKPSNMLVTNEGRVVILDFGLAVELREGARSRQENEIVGTVAYMAPEQAAARPLNAAADWYAVGVILFQALTGQLPFSGDPVQLLTDKQTRSAPDPRELEPNTPTDLAELTVALLQVNPNDRPRGMEMLARLEPARTLEPELSFSSFDTNAFVGRHAELQAIMQAMSDVKTEGPQVVCLSGESGLGKSALLRQLSRILERHSPIPIVLEGACHERESVPYKGIDGALDTLTNVLGSMDVEWVKRCLPPEAGLLCQFFPVLSRLSAFAEAPRFDGISTADPNALRHRLFVALRQLLSNLALNTTVVVMVDDVQWAGGDTWALLKEVFRGSEAPKVLLVTTVRPDGVTTEEILRRRHEELSAANLKWLRMSPLSNAESRTLATQLLHRLGAPPELVNQAVAESAGHPLLLDALARAGMDTQVRTLDGVLLKRVAAMNAVAQKVLEFASLSNAPLAQIAVAGAANLNFADFSAQVGALKVGRLVRTSGVRALDTIEPFHDRIRIAVLSSIPPENQRGMHERLAIALERVAVPDYEALEWHWTKAGDPARAARHAERAGNQAMERLAFERAAHFFQIAVAFSPKVVSLREQLGEALIGAGRGAEAGEAFEAAASISSSLEALEFTRKAAHEFLRSGHVERGLARLSEVLNASGEKIVESRSAVLASLFFKRVFLFFRGFDFDERSVKQLPALAVLRVDATWAASEVFSTLDMVRGAELQVRNLLLALSAGEPQRVARALAMESVMVAVGGAQQYPRARKIHAVASSISERIKNESTVGVVLATEGIIEFMAGHFPEARERLRQAVKTLQTDSRGTHFELANARSILMLSHFYLGHLREFLDQVPEFLEEGKRRGDRFALTYFRVHHFNAYWTAMDDAPTALSEVDTAVQQLSTHGYQTLHYYAMLARAQMALYCGQGELAHALVLEDWPKMKNSFLLRAHMLRLEALHLRARAAWAAGDEKDARRSQKMLQREDHPFAVGLAASMDAAFALENALSDRQWNDAVRVLEKSNLLLLLRAAKYRRYVGTSEGAAVRAWFQEQGVKRPEAFVQMLIPSRGGPGVPPPEPNSISFRA